MSRRPGTGLESRVSELDDMDLDAEGVGVGRSTVAARGQSGSATRVPVLPCFVAYRSLLPATS